jgi:MFS family permease
MALALWCVASFMAVVDTTIVSIALPSIMRAMEFSPSGSQWVLNAYALVFGGLLFLGRSASYRSCSWWPGKFPIPVVSPSYADA